MLNKSILKFQKNTFLILW